NGGKRSSSAERSSQAYAYEGRSCPALRRVTRSMSWSCIRRRLSAIARTSPTSGDHERQQGAALGDRRTAARSRRLIVVPRVAREPDEIRIMGVLTALKGQQIWPPSSIT